MATAILDGSIDTPWGKDRVANGGAEDGKISPDEVSSVSKLREPREILTAVDCRELLVLTYTAPVCLHAGT